MCVDHERCGLGRMSKQTGPTGRRLGLETEVTEVRVFRTKDQALGKLSLFIFVIFENISV